MKMTKTVVMALAAALATVCASCGDSESYANRLNTERNSCNSYLTTKRVENNIPADTVFETGEDAPFYRINPDGNVYMQVIKCTPRKEDRAMKGQTIYFRYTRYNINQWYSDKHKREINRYTLHKQVFDEATGKNVKIELFSTYSLLQMVFFMRDYWYMLNGIELPTDNEIWNKKRKETILADGTTEGT